MCGLIGSMTACLTCFATSEGTLLLGTVERIDEFITDLANVRQWPAPTSVRHLNRTAENQRATRDELEEIYVSAARDDRLGTMVAAEQALYAKARSIAATQRELMSMKRLGQTARRVWQSADGEIVLGKNFGRREMIDGEAAWWTLEACESQIHETSRTIATLHAEIRISHGIASSCIQVWMDDRRLDARIEQSSDSSCSLVVPLDGLRGDRWATVTLHIVDRLAAIDNPLWHHALLLYRFCLT